MKEQLKKLHACDEALQWASQFETFPEAWAACERGDWMLWIAGMMRIDSRKLTLAKGLIAQTVEHLMTDERSKAAVKAAIDYGKGVIGDEELAAAAAAADVAADAAAAAAAAAYAYTAADAAAAAAAVYTAADVAAAAAAYAYAAAHKESMKNYANICREFLTEEMKKTKIWKATAKK